MINGSKSLSRIQDNTKRHATTFAFSALATIFVTSLIIANVMATKISILGGMVFPAGIVVFPISYIISDVLTEVYGFRMARRVILLGFGCNLLGVALIWIGQLLPSAPFWLDQEAYVRILGNSPRILAASFTAYLIGELANSLVLSKLKVATQGRYLWLRTIGSTLVGQGLDSLVFVSIAFIGTLPETAVAYAILNQWLFKVVYEAVATPATYIAVSMYKTLEGTTENEGA